MQRYFVRNWRRYQHYKHRNPPWIKLHQDLLTSQDWLIWSDASRLAAICCLLVASRYDGFVPADPLYLKRCCRLRFPVNFKPLIKSGFLVVDASNMLADASNMLARVQSPETESKIVSLNIEKREKPERKKKPRHGSRTKDGKRIWFDRDTQEWNEYARDFEAANCGIKPALQWDNSGTWFNYFGELKNNA